MSVGSDGNNDFNSTIYPNVSVFPSNVVYSNSIGLWSKYVGKKEVCSHIISGGGTEQFVLKEGSVLRIKSGDELRNLQLYALSQKRQPCNPQHCFHL